MIQSSRFRPFRYGLRTLLLLITLVCILLTVLPHEARQYYGRKTRAHQHVLALGGTVDEFGYSEQPSPGTNWLSRSLGYSEAQEKLWEVNLAGRPVTRADLKWIRNCDWIRVLNLTDTKVEDDALSHVAESTGLIELRLAETKVTDFGVQKLGALKHLVVLDVHETSVTYAGLFRLEQRIPGTNFQEQLAISRVAIPALTVHVGTPSRFRTIEYDSSISPPVAGTLHFTRPVALTPGQIEDIRRLSSARSLIAGGVVFPADGLKFIVDLRNLESISLDEGRAGNLRDDDMRWLTKLPKLKSLHISTSNLTNDALRHIAAIPQLESLDIGGTKFTDDGIALMASALSLQSLTLNGTQLTPGLLVHLRRMPQLSSLHLYLWHRNSIGKTFGPPPDAVVSQASDSMKVLAEFPALTELGTRGNLMTPDVLAPVAKLAKLERLQVDGRFVSHEAARTLQEAMPHCHVQWMSGE